MASKRVEKFAIRKRADGVIRDRKRVDRFDETLRGSHLPAEEMEEMRLATDRSQASSIVEHHVGEPAPTGL